MIARRLEPVTNVNLCSAEDRAAAEASGRVLMKSHSGRAEATRAALITAYFITQIKQAHDGARTGGFHHAPASLHPGRDPNCLSGQCARWKMG